MSRSTMTMRRPLAKISAGPEDVTSRRRSPFSKNDYIARAIWGVCWNLIFRTSPRPFHSWRRGLLRLFGAKVSGTAHIYPGVRVWAPWNLEIGEVVGVADGVTLYSQDRIVLEDHVIVSQESYLCTGSHDYRRNDFPLWTAPIVVGRNTWIAARVFIHPGVTIGADSVVAACSVVTRDIPSGMIAAGNPAKVIKPKYEHNPDR